MKNKAILSRSDGDIPVTMEGISGGGGEVFLVGFCEGLLCGSKDHQLAARQALELLNRHTAQRLHHSHDQNILIQREWKRFVLRDQISRKHRKQRRKEVKRLQRNNLRSQLRCDQIHQRFHRERLGIHR